MEHYFSEKQKSKLNVKEINIDILNHSFIFLTPSGVFSFGKFDNGSKLLINKSIIKEKSKVLDLGCGYGNVGICISKAYKVEVTLSDINERAINFTKKNAIKNNVNVEIIKSNAFQEINQKFDTILFNPPQHAGKDLCLSMIEESINYLNDNGTLQVVARHNKGGKSFEEHMKKIFNNCEHVAIKSGYRIYLSKK